MRTHALAVVAAALAALPAVVPADAPLTAAQARYLENCGGCHGIQGASARREIPALSGRVGVFAQTPAGRAYLVQLPDVAFANLGDQALADVMNFVVFGLGGASTPRDAAPYTAVEVGELRRAPLKSRDIGRIRAEILAQTVTN